MQEEADYFGLRIGIGKLNIDDQAVASSESTFQSTNFGQSSQQECPNHFDEQNQVSINDVHQTHPQVSAIKKFFNQEGSKTLNWQMETESEPIVEVAVRHDEEPKEHLTFLTFAKVQNINQGTLLEEGLSEVDGQTYRGNENNQQDKREGFNIKKLKKQNKRLFQQKSQSTFVYLTDEGEETFTKISYIQTLTRTQDLEIILPNKREVSVDSKSQLISKKIFKTPIISKLSLSQKKIFDESSQKQKTLLSQDIKDLLYEEAKLQAIKTNLGEDFPQALKNKPGEIFSFILKKLKKLVGSADPERLKEVRDFIYNEVKDQK